MTDHDETAGPDSICVGCGLCCDGTIFGFVPLHDGDDEDTLVHLGLTIEPREDKVGFSQPCAASCGGACSIYDDRPKVCRGYRCALLIENEAGRTSSDEARRRIATATQLRDEVTAGLDRLLPVSEPTALYARYPLLLDLERRARGVEPEPSRSAEAAFVLLDVATLRVHLKTHFDLDLDSDGPRALGAEAPPSGTPAPPTSH